MCIHKKFVRNPYTGDHILVSCGHCPSCLQQKANSRAFRIRNEEKVGFKALFCHLSYDRFSAPYIYQEDLIKGNKTVNVYRDSYLTHDKRRKVYALSTLLVKDFFIGDYPADFDAHQLYPLEKSPGKSKIGICYYKDIQDFKKRFKQNLIRKYGFSSDYPLSWYWCSEYGEEHQRPHFHGLIFCKASDFETLKSCVVESWPFAASWLTRRNIEEARDAASYTASYVNSDSYLSPLFKLPSLRQRHSTSRGFGLGLECFQLDSILHQIQKGDLSFRIFDKTRTQFADLPLPKYVVNRWFPIFKGYNRLTDDEKFLVLLNPARLHTFKTSNINYTCDDIHKISVRLTHAADVYHVVTGRSIYDFASDFISAWSVLALTRYKCDMLNPVYRDYPLEHYYNIGMYVNGKVRNYSLDEFIDSRKIAYDSIIENYNQFKTEVFHSAYLERLYFEKDKSRKVNDCCRTLRAEYDEVEYY